MAMTLRPDPELEAALRKLSQRRKCPYTDVIRDAVMDAARRSDEDELVHALYQEVAATRRDVLDQLSDS
jgi:hypothetical protein